MKKTFSILLIYLLFLLLFYFISRWLGLADWEYIIAKKIPITALFIAAAVGGIISLKFAVSPASFRIFLILYSALWVLRLLILYLGTKMGAIQLGNKAFDIPAILTNYFTFVFRLDTPLPFMFFLLIDYLFTRQDNNSGDFEKT
jgi:hypothetical protein